MKASGLVTLILLLVPAVCAGAAQWMIYPAPIPDGHPGGLVARQVITGCDTIEDLDVALEIDHHWTGDLVITLESPMGTRITLVDRPGFDGSGYGCQFAGLSALLDDEAALALEDQCTDDLGGTVPAISGTLSPSEPLSAFDGELGSGVWTLRVSDWAEENTGKLVSWNLQFDCSSRDIDLQADLTADRSWAGPGDTVIFTLRLVNAGSEPAGGVEVDYGLPEGLECLWAEPGAFGEGELITQRFGSLAQGESVEALLAATVTASQWEPLKVTAHVRAEQTDSCPWNDRASAGVRIGPGSSGTSAMKDLQRKDIKP